MILADENIHSFIIRALRNAGFDVTSVQKTAPGISDQQVIEWAVHNQLVILTEDKDFGEWVFAHHIKEISVLFLRYSFADYKQMAETLCSFLGSQPIEHPVFITLTTNKIRIRKL